MSICVYTTNSDLLQGRASVRWIRSVVGSRAGLVVLWHHEDASLDQLSHFEEIADLQVRKSWKRMIRMRHEMNCVCLRGLACSLSIEHLTIPLLVVQDTVQFPNHVCRDPVPVFQACKLIPKRQKE